MFRTISKIVLSIAAVSALTMSFASPVSAHYSTAAANCVDGTKRSNLSVNWNATDSVTFKTAGDKLLCEDVTVWFSSYTLPDNYNGQGFTNNPTATPQNVFASTSFLMKKGTTGAKTLQIQIPEACKHMQIDLYYGPEITLVTAAGHGAQYITGKILSKTQETCTPETPEEPPVVPPTPEAQTPPTEPPVVTVVPQTPVELPKTGAGTNAIIAVTAFASVAGYAVSQAASKRR